MRRILLGFIIMIFGGVLAAAPAFAQLTGVLKVRSFPAGAVIEVDGVSTGKLTPANLALSLGDHTVTVSAPGDGWNTDTRTVTIASGSNDLYVTLVPTTKVEGPIFVAGSEFITADPGGDTEGSNVRYGRGYIRFSSFLRVPVAMYAPLKLPAACRLHRIEFRYSLYPYDSDADFELSLWHAQGYYGDTSGNEPFARFRTFTPTGGVTEFVTGATTFGPFQWPPPSVVYLQVVVKGQGILSWVKAYCE